jgi:hypothetical protein
VVRLGGPEPKTARVVCVCVPLILREGVNYFR